MGGDKSVAICQGISEKREAWHPLERSYEISCIGADFVRQCLERELTVFEVYSDYWKNGQNLMKVTGKNKH